MKTMILASVNALTVGALIRKEVDQIDPDAGTFSTQCNNALYLASKLPIDPAEIPATIAAINDKRDMLKDENVMAGADALNAVEQAVMANAKNSAKVPEYKAMFDALGYDFDNVNDVDEELIKDATTASRTLGAGPIDDRAVHAAAAE